MVFRTKINSPDVTIYFIKLIPSRKNHNHNSTGISSFPLTHTGTDTHIRKYEVLKKHSHCGNGV